LTSSLEYQWPLSFNLSAHLFFDALFVGRRPALFTLENAPWAFGAGLDYHMRDGELARGTLSYGSEGFEIIVNIGFDPLQNSRGDWD